MFSCVKLFVVVIVVDAVAVDDDVVQDVLPIYPVWSVPYLTLSPCMFNYVSVTYGCTEGWGSRRFYCMRQGPK